VKLARKIGGNPALAQFELEIIPAPQSRMTSSQT
jgi:hypothetical protein